MRIGKPHPAPRQRVNIWSVNLATLAAVALHVTDPEVVRKNENDVRLRRRMQSARKQQGQEKLKSHGSRHYTDLIEQANPVGVILVPR
jgi:hypothetical protein